MLALLTLLACLPEPQPAGLDSGAASDDTASDDSGTSSSSVTVSGNVIWSGPEEPEPSGLIVAVHHFPISADFGTGALFASSEPSQMPSLSSPGTYELSLPEEPDGEYLQSFGTDVLGAVFLVSAWQDPGDGSIDGTERLVGTSPTVLFYLRGNLDAEYTGAGFEEGWNRVDFEYWITGVATSAAHIDGSTTALNIETNLLPHLPSELEGSTRLDEEADRVAVLDLVGSCETRRYEALTTTGLNDQAFRWPDFPADIDPTEWDTTDAAHACGEIPEGRPVDVAFFELVAFVDTDRDGAWSKTTDQAVASSSTSTEPSLLMFLTPINPSAYFYVNAGATMGWNRVSAKGESEELEVLDWQDAFID